MFSPYPKANLVLLYACLAASILVGCDRFGSNRSLSLQAIPETSEFPPAQLTSTYHGQPMRLTKAYFQAYTERAVPPLEIDIRADSRQGSVEAATGNLILSGTRKPAPIEIEFGAHADAYNELHVRMKVSAGNKCAVGWKSTTSVSRNNPTPITAPIIPDNEFHTYEIALTGPYDDRWSGIVNSIQFTPSDEPAVIEIESMQLVFRPIHGPRKVTSAAQTHETLIGDPPAWRFTVPPKATFEAYVGFPDLNLRGSSNARGNFRVQLERDQQEPITLVEQTLLPKENQGYLRISADLAAYQGEEVTLRFSSEASPAMLSDFVLWGNPTVFSREPSTLPPVILISVDTLRADHLSSYGYHRTTTPNLDKLAEEGVVFENAICQETYTLSSHMTMFTGLYPKHHITTPQSAFDESKSTLTEVLQNAGYSTGGFTGFKGWLKPDFGFGQGFDFYNTPVDIRRNVFQTHAPAIDWLNEAPRPGPFLFLHNYDVHGYRGAEGRDNRLPYGSTDPAFSVFSKKVSYPESLDVFDPKEPNNDDFFNAIHSGHRGMSPEEIEYIRALYDDAILSVDKAINDVFDTLKEQGLYEDALIIVTADHGEALGDPTPTGRPLLGHGWVYDNSAKVPLIVKFPKGRFAGRRYSGLVQTIDIMPTIFDELNIEFSEPIDGKSLVPLLENQAEPTRYAYTQRHAGQSVRDKDWKLILNTNDDSYELLDVANNPEETEDYYPEQPEVAGGLKQELARFYTAGEEGWHITWHRNGGVQKEISISIYSDEEFQTLKLLVGDTFEFLKEYVEKTDRSVSVNIGRRPSEQIYLLPSSPQDTLQLKIESPESVRVIVGDNPPQMMNGWQTILDPATAQSDRIATVHEDDTPTIRIVYKPGIDTESGTPLSDEEKAQLEALGYVGELEPESP